MICRARPSRTKPRWRPTWLVAVAVLPLGTGVRAQGLVLPGLGPINRSMGGAGTAAPLDAIGAIHWNPASITALESSRVDLGVEFLSPAPNKVSSKVDANAFGPGQPATTVSGSTESDSTFFPLPAIGVVHKPDDSRWTWGLGIFAIGGLAFDYPGDSSNPILSPQPPGGLGFGSPFSRLSILQAAPTIAFQLADQISVGVAPTLTIVDVGLEPFALDSPDDANGDGFATFPSGTSSLPEFGGGVQAGIYYEAEVGLHLGAAIKSPQWFDTFKFNSDDEIGMDRTLETEFEYPMIATFGAAYSGFERWLIAADFRFVNYRNAEAFGSAEFDSAGALKGLGWNDVFFAGLGLQHQLLDVLSLRLGYAYSNSPVSDGDAFFNVVSAPLYEHSVFVGASYEFTKDWLASLTYFHAFENSIRGRFVGATGPVPGTSVKIEASLDAIVVGLTAKWGLE